TSVFLVVGLCYVACGGFYRLPVPVQPLKAVAAIAIATGLSQSVVSAAGLIMGLLLLIMAVTGLVGAISKLFPVAVVRGVQLGVALFLIRAGLSLVSNQQVIIGGDTATVTMASLSVPVGWLLAAGWGAVLIVCLRNRKVPAALVLLLGGVLVGGLWGSFSGLRSLRFGLSLPAVGMPTLADLGIAFVVLVIPQIPLTLGNAIYATADAAAQYFGKKGERVKPRALATTMGIANVGAGLLGAMPVCHGSGGLTAHYRLGARTGMATITLGLLLLALALFFHGSAMPVLSLIPYSVLGVLVLFVGVQHGLLARNVRGRSDILVCVLTGLVGLITGNLAWGFAAGIVLYHVLRVWARRRERLLRGAENKA
ncbi:MAG: sulfate permease, partial [Chloroflexi bacterium]|nr:sulfate permease [Chloroflexota bacterium]